jgi:type III restriction enzyme
MRNNRSEPEKYFEKMLDESEQVDWWYKNGEKLDRYFAIPYQSEDTERAFYPDYIVRFIDGRIGIYDTKSGFTAESEETAAKSNALQKYITGQNKDGKNLDGGILVKRSDGLYLFDSEEFIPFEKDKSKWRRFDIS